MSIPLQNLIDNPSLIDDLLDYNISLCCYCGCKLKGNITGKNKTPKGIACDDCYYENLGKLIEEYPKFH